jgi:hypothetical protein
MKSIKTVFIAITIAIVLVIFAGQTVFSLVQFNSIIGQEVKNSLKYRAEDDASNLNSYIQGIETVGKVIANNIQAMPTIQIDTLSAMIGKYIEDNKIVYGAGFWLEPNVV